VSGASTIYDPGSITWRVNQEPALLLGGGRALLMQLAHPGVAAGVAEHSDFRRRPLARLMRTLELTLALAFGTWDEARAAARQINAVHQRVRGAGYSAMDPRLLLWVHATLIDSAVAVYDALVEALSPVELETYYQEVQVIGGLLGLPRPAYPESWAGFSVYMTDTIEGGELVIDDRARELAASVLRPPLRHVPGTAFWPLQALTAGLLPATLRNAYGLPWGRPERLAYAGARRLTRTSLRLVPRRLRMVPQARRALRVR
jgi:uncharacterized protein (DUF2236 family)